MDKDKGKINSMEADREECDRQLRAMGFDTANRPASRDGEGQAHNEADDLYDDSINRCLKLLVQEASDPEEYVKKEKYKLTDDENKLFNKLPEWHRDLFIHFSGEWSITKKIFDEEQLIDGNSLINQLLIKCSLKSVLAEDEIACYLWDFSEDMRQFDSMSDEMDLREVSAIVFPLVAYQEEAESFERLALRVFQKERISIGELEKKVSYSLALSDIGILVYQVWKKYLDDKKEYIDIYNKSVMNSVFNNKKAGSSIESPSLQEPAPPQPITPPTASPTPPKPKAVSETTSSLTGQLTRVQVDSLLHGTRREYARLKELVHGESFQAEIARRMCSWYAVQMVDLERELNVLLHDEAVSQKDFSELKSRIDDRLAVENAEYQRSSQPRPRSPSNPPPQAPAAPQQTASPTPPKPQRTRKATPLLDACLTVWRKQPECQDAQPATAIQLLNVVMIQQGVAGHPKLRVSGDKIEWAEGGSLEMKHFKAAFERHFGR